MKLALIPPACLFGYHARSDYQLLLPELWFKYPNYRLMFGSMKEARPEGSQYYILDNGAAEGNSYSADELMRCAVASHADEIVIPDLIKDSEGSMQALEGFMHYLGKSAYNPAAFKWMAVAQGQSHEEVFQYIDWLMTEWRLDLTSIGLPRHLLGTLNSSYARIDIASALKDTYGDDLPALHFLGANPLWCTELEAAAKEVPWVRGYDTSMPFVYGWQREFLEDTKQISRPKNYFALRYEQEQAEFSEKNVQTMLEWVR